MQQDFRERYINFYTKLLEKPQIMEEEIFTHLFEQAEIAKFSKKELHEYEESLKAYRDWYSVTKTSFDKGKAEGLQEGLERGIERGIEQGETNKAKEIALNLMKLGIDADTIAKGSGLSIADINKLRSSL